MGLKGILSLLGKAGKRVFSPKTQARNLKSGRDFNRAQERSTWMADPAKRNMYNESMEAAKKEVDKLIKQGQVSPNDRLESYKRMEHALLREYDKVNIPDPIPIPGSNFPQFPKELIESLGKKAAWTAVGLGVGGAAGYYAGTRAEDDAVEEMEEVTQTKSRGTEVGENIANKLMDIISPIPRYK